MEADSAEPPMQLRIRGQASPEEVAAVLMALDPRAAAPPPQRQTPPWQRASLWEGVGERSAAAPDDLR